MPPRSGSSFDCPFFDCPLRIRAVRRGGFAGIAASATTDSALFPPQVAASVEQALRDASATAPGAARPDRFVYEFTLGEGAAAPTAVLPEDHVPDALKPLLDHLAGQWRPGR